MVGIGYEVPELDDTLVSSFLQQGQMHLASYKEEKRQANQNTSNWLEAEIANRFAESQIYRQALPFTKARIDGFAVLLRAARLARVHCPHPEPHRNEATYFPTP